MIRVDALDRFCSLVLVVAAPWMATIFNNSLTMQVIGVPLTTIGGGLAGTFAAIAYDPHSRDRPRGQQFLIAPATVIVACALVAFVPRMFNLTWVNAGTEGGVAAIMALLIYYLLPVAIERGPTEARRVRVTDLLSYLLPWIRRNSPPQPRDGDKDKTP